MAAERAVDDASEVVGVTAERRYEPDEIDQQLLNELQSSFPLNVGPYAVVGAKLGLTEAEVIERVQRLKDEQIIRQISAIFDSRRLGYTSSLVAMKFDPDQLDAGAAVINQHPGVSHNYKRNHAYNLWFTIAVPPHKSLEREVELLAERAKPIKTWLLPTLKLYKIGVNLDMTAEAPITSTESGEDSIGQRSAKRWSKEIERPTFSADQLTAIRLLQQDLPLTPRPFDTLADGSGIDGARLVELALELEQQQYLRRFAAVLHHRKAGFRANAMGVWVVPRERIDEVGTQMATFKAVSHCYERPTYEDWPYSVFTMIHGRHSRDCEAVVEAIAEATSITEYELLYSTKEYKKTRVRYFLDDDQFDVESIAARE